MRCPLDGKVVVVTGASSGIGRAMARQLAGRARTLALVARRRERLEALKAELCAAHPRLTVEVLPCDLSDLADTKRLVDELAARVGAVDVLVNNAGVADYGVFDRADWPRTERLITLDVTSLALLTHALVGPMVARGSGGVLNLSSGYGLGVTPGFAAYIGAKHFVTGFTEALRLDLAGTGVVVTLVCPGPVRTEFAEVVGYPGGKDITPSFAYQSEDACARAALRGLERGRALVVPGWVMKILYLLIAVSPRFVRRWAMLPFARLVRRQLPPSP